MHDEKFATGMVEALLTAIDNKDWDSLAKLLNEDSVYEVHGFPPYTGKKEILEYYENIRPIQAGVHTIESIYTGLDSVVCCGVFVGMKKDGSRIDISFADELRFHNFKISKRRVYFCNTGN